MRLPRVSPKHERIGKTGMPRRSTRTFMLLLACACIGGSTLALAQMSVQRAFLTGNEYVQRSPWERERLVVGVVEGFFASALIGARQVTLQRMQRCLQPMDSGQLRAILDRYVIEHPQWRHQHMGVLMYRALNEGCLRK